MNFKIRRATADDVDEIAEAHLDSIRTIGRQFYPPEIVNDWSAEIKGEMYSNAMKQGEVFFIAVADNSEILGFSSHRIDDEIHGVSVYVRGKAARHGVGTALLRAAEESAIAAKASNIQIDASLAAFEFYIANGFKEISRGEHQLLSGRSMPCIFMRKELEKSVSDFLKPHDLA
ncbi:GNAT family N-acetyltransferase [bacterium]|nr:GNAT family N-acetyltransferase [bacterium]